MLFEKDSVLKNKMGNVAICLHSLLMEFARTPPRSHARHAPHAPRLAIYPPRPGQPFSLCVAGQLFTLRVPKAIMMIIMMTTMVMMTLMVMILKTL